MCSLSLTRRIDSLIRFFLYVLIFWLPYSPAVIESCVIISVILWFVKRIAMVTGQKEPTKTFGEKICRFFQGIRLEPTFLNRPIAFFLAACILSVTSSAFFVQSLHNFLTKTLEWFIIYSLVVEVFKDKKHIYIALTIFAFTAFSTVIDSLIQFHITYKDIFLGNTIVPGDRATAGFKTSNSLGGYLTGVIPALAVWIFWGKQRTWGRLLALLFLFFAAWSLLVTFSRGAWIGVFFGGIFLLVFVLFPKKRVQFYFSLGLLWIIIFLCGTFFLILAKGSDQELFARYQTVDWRLNIWVGSMAMIKDKFFFGHGINTFMRIFQAYRGNLLMDPTYAHNCYIQLAVETGIIGLSCFLWIIVRTFHQLIGEIKLDSKQNSNLDILSFGLLSGVFAFLVHCFFDTNMYSLQLSTYLWFMVGMLVAIYNVLDMQRRFQEA